MDHLSYAVGSVFSWSLLGAVSYNFFNFSSSIFQGYKKREKKYEFVSYFVAIVHAVIASYNGIYGILYTW